MGLKAGHADLSGLGSGLLGGGARLILPGGCDQHRGEWGILVVEPEQKGLAIDAFHVGKNSTTLVQPRVRGLRRILGGSWSILRETARKDMVYIF